MELVNPTYWKSDPFKIKVVLAYGMFSNLTAKMCVRPWEQVFDKNINNEHA